MYFARETNSRTISYDELAQQFSGTEFLYLSHSVWNNLLIYLVNCSLDIRILRSSGALSSFENIVYWRTEQVIMG